MSSSDYCREHNEWYGGGWCPKCAWGTTSTTTAPDRPLTMVDIESAIWLCKFSDPVADAMRREGFDPDKGALLIMPVDNPPTYPPAYMRFSRYLTQPVMLRTSGFEVLEIAPRA